MFAGSSLYASRRLLGNSLDASWGNVLEPVRVVVVVVVVVVAVVVTVPGLRLRGLLRFREDVVVRLSVAWGQQF